MKLAKDQKPVKVPTKKIELELDKEVVETIIKMEQYTKISKEELVTTALKRFITSHSDYLPPK